MLGDEATIDDVLVELDGNWGPCVGLYYHGSVIFGNKNPHDVDLLAIIDEPTLRPLKASSKDSQFTLGRYEVSVFTRDFWLRKLEEMDLTMLTCLSLAPEFVARPLEDRRMKEAIVDLGKLRESIVSYAEYTWLKARRVLERWKDVYKASKNIYFVFRVLEFGVQLAEHKRIVNFTAANHWWGHIRDIFDALQIGTADWEVIEAIVANDAAGELARFIASTEAGAGPSDGGRPMSCAPVRRNRRGDVTCAMCLGPLEPDEDTADPGAEAGEADPGQQVVTLVRCGHAFHRRCIASWLRADGFKSACPTCRQSVRLPMDERLAISRELQRRGVELPAGRRQRFGGYPGTVLLPEEQVQPGDQPAAGEEASPAQETEPGPGVESGELLPEEPAQPGEQPAAGEEACAAQETEPGPGVQSGEPAPPPPGPPPSQDEAEEEIQPAPAGHGEA